MNFMILPRTQRPRRIRSPLSSPAASTVALEGRRGCGTALGWHCSPVRRRRRQPGLQTLRVLESSSWEKMFLKRRPISSLTAIYRAKDWYNIVYSDFCCLLHCHAMALGFRGDFKKMAEYFPG